ncbi:MAG: pitrilysin family protein [Pseudomonadota bacterium]
MKRFSTATAALVAAGALSLAVATASAADIDIEYTEYTLDNGLRLVVHEDNKAPIVAINVWYHVGSRNEEPGKTGFAHLFEHLMFNGSENYNDEFFKPFERVGATNMNGTTWFDRTNYFENVPKTALDMALWMESDRMGHMLGAVTQERLDEQRGVVQNEKRQGDNQPYGRTEYNILAGVFPPGHPYSWSTIGSMEDLNAASLDDVHAWFKRYYGPNNAVIVIAGDVSPDEAFEKVKTYFGDIPPGPPLDKFETWTVKLDEDKRETMQDRVPQARIYKAWGAPNFDAEDADLLQLADAVLTTGKTSRLYNRLVYTDQIATAVNSQQFAGDIAGYYQIIATAQPGGDLVAVERAVDEELERFLKEGPTREELQRAKSRLTSGVVRGLEQVGGFGGKSDILARNAVYTGDPSFYKTSLERIENATPEAVRDAANRWLGAGVYNLEVHPFPQLAAANEGADRSMLPETTSFPEVSFDDFERDFLSNGLELIVAERNAVPVINFSMRFDAGYASDQFGLPGTSSLAMAMLDEGTAKRTALEISDEAALLGAGIGAGSGIDSSTVSLNALSANLDESLDLYTDIILNPAFPEQELERLRKQRLAGIQQEKNQPVGMALRLFPKLLYGDDHAYSLPLTGSGTEDSVSKITRESLVDYHQTWFRPNNATLIVVGDTTMAEIRPKLERLLRRWEPADVPTKNIGDVAVRANESVYIIDRPGAQQSVLLAANVAPRRGAGNEIAIESMNEIIGGSFTSRVNMNLREDKNWAYGAFTLMLDTKGQRPFIVYAPVQTDKTMESIAELKRELVQYLGDNPATDEELAKVKDNNTLSLPGRWETAAAVLQDIGQIVTYDLDDDYWDTYANNVRDLSLDQINTAADAVIKPNNLVWVVVGDREKIESRIRELEFGEITLLDVDGNEVVPTAAN